MRIYHIDLEFEGKRLIDNVKIIEKISSKRVMVYSPKLRANIIINKSELKGGVEDGI